MDTSIDAGDDISQCPECKTSKAVLPTMKILYSSCCGRALCDACVGKLFSRQNRVACAACGQTTKQSEYFADSRDTQSYNKEAETRGNINRSLSLERKDFASLEEYNDYLESVQSIVYGLVHGSRDEKVAADKSFQDLKRQMETRRQRALMRKATETQKPLPAEAVASTQALSSELGSDRAAAATAPAFFAMPALPLAVAPKPRATPPLVAEKAGKPVDLQAQYRLEVMRTFGKIAGGFNEQYNKERSYQEAFLALCCPTGSPER